MLYLFSFDLCPHMLHLGVTSVKWIPHLKDIPYLKRVFIKELDSSPYRTLRLTKKNLGELAGVLVEFAEDIHNDIGIWKALEQYNQEVFSARLPFIHQSEENREQMPFDKYSIWHLLWVVCSELKPQLIFWPIHKDLLRIATIASGFLAVYYTNHIDIRIWYVDTTCIGTDSNAIGATLKWNGRDNRPHLY